MQNSYKLLLLPDGVDGKDTSPGSDTERLSVAGHDQMNLANRMLPTWMVRGS